MVENIPLLFATELQIVRIGSVRHASPSCMAIANYLSPRNHTWDTNFICTHFAHVGGALTKTEQTLTIVCFYDYWGRVNNLTYFV